MQTQLTAIWERSTAHYCAHLNDRDRRKMVAITSQQDLLLHMRALEITYHQHNISRALKRTQPFVAQIRSFTHIINIFIQSDPKISALVWGPCALVLELAARHEDTLELIGELFEKFERVLPRFQEYLKEFGSRALTGRLEQALVTYYSELIAFYQDAIKFLSVQPWKNILLIKRPAIQFNSAAKRRLATLREKTSWVEDEVGWTKYQVQQDQHKMIVDLLNSDSNGRGTAAAPRFKLPYRSLPYARNYQFHFRENILKQLASSLQPTAHQANLRTASLYGLGGVGKTQVALEFAYRYSEDYDAIFWIKADTETGLRESIYTHARAVDDHPEAAPQQDAALIKRFLNWLMTAKNDEGKLVPWLLIFDNVDDARLIERFWPKGSHGSVLVTTRNREVSVTFGNKAFQVELFTEVESSAFMMHLNPYAGKSDDEELRLVSQITDRLGHLPLVLDHIGSYIRTTSSSYRTFLRFYKDFDTNLLFESGSINLSYERSIRNTWTMSLTTIDPAARSFMELLVLFEPDGVPLQLFEACDETAKMHNGPSDEFPRLDECLKGRLPNREDTDTVISSLIAGSLISRGWEGDLVSCHRIVREAVLKSLAPEMLILHFDWAVFALNACFPKTPHSAPLLKDWDQCATFHPHVSTLVAIFHRYSDSMPYPILLCEVIRRCAWYLFERGNYKAATEMATVACEILEKASDHGVHPGYFPRYICRLTADMYTMLGSIEYELNLPLHGQHWFQKSDQHRRKLLEDDNAEAFDLETMAIVDCNRALAILADGPANAAIASCRLLLDTFDNESSRGIWAANLSIAYRLNNELTESLEWCQKSQEWTSSNTGKDSLSMAIVHFNTGCTYLSMKKDDLALQAFEQCLAIRREKSAFHPYTGFTCHKIGVVLRARGDLSHAVTLFRSAIQILQNCESHEGATVRSKNSLAVTLEELGAFDEAEALRREIIVSLNSLEKPFAQDDGNISEDYFEQFVLYCHR